MPRVGYVVGDELLSYDEVMQRATQDGGLLNFPPPVWAAMHRHTERTGGFHLTPSLAGSCLRQRLLQASEDYYVIPEKLWAILDGISWHSLFEDGSEFQEHSLLLPLSVPLDRAGEGGVGLRVGIGLVGRLDHYSPETKRLTDYKRTAAFGYRGEVGKWFPKEYPEAPHVTQTNLYALLLRHAGYEVDEIQIFYFQSDNKASRKLVHVPVWSYHEALDTAVDMAIPIAIARDYGKLPACTCRYGPGYMNRDLCKEVSDEDWHRDGWPRLRSRTDSQPLCGGVGEGDGSGTASARSLGRL